MPNLQEYMTIKDAAEFLGVSQNTLRNWGTSGKIPEHRNPVNSYRLYKVSDLEKLLKAVEKSSRKKRKPR